MVRSDILIGDIQLTDLPQTPGVYLMRDNTGKIIYVGKAKNLKKRVSSYFQKQDIGAKNFALLGALQKLDYLECASEREALLLEEQLIKKYQPIFNAMWKDDKSYPYVVVSTQEDFPRIYLARKKHIPAGARAFGPYPNVSKVKHLIRGLFRSGAIALRPCRWDFSVKKPLDPKIINSCIYYHTKTCPAPCAALISKTRYRSIAKQATLLFSGRQERLHRHLEKQMKKAAKVLDFEKAGRLKSEIEALDHIGEGVMITSLNKEDFVLLYAPKEAVQSLQEALHLKFPPAHIETFDISNLQGTYAVGSMVCFVGGKPNKDHYRRFRIKTVSGINDFAMIEEVVRRRYQRVLNEKEPLPNLILIDGGIGQLQAAKNALTELKLIHRVHLASLAKREEILYVLGEGKSEEKIKEIRLGKDHEGLRLAMASRDEAHRFAITYHKTLRKRGFFEGHES